MPNTCRRVARVIACLLVVAFSAAPALGQITSLHTPGTAVAGRRANVFLNWSGTRPADGFLLNVPSGAWQVDSLTILNASYRAASSGLDRLDARTYRVAVDETLVGPHDVIFHLRTGDAPRPGRLEVIPLVRVGGVLSRLTELRQERRIRLVRPPEAHKNFALSFEGRWAEPLVLRQARTPDVSLDRPHAVSFWIRTVGLSEVILSTWNGDERRTYPLEIVVDATGRLRAFRGRPGEHQSLISNLPVADGAWHRVTLSHRPDDGWTRLDLDGETVDSLFARPSIHLQRIEMELPLAIGGRSEGPSPYFDGLRPFSGWIDAVRIEPLADERSDRKPLRMDFDDGIPNALLERPVRGVRREPAELGEPSTLEEFRAVPAANGVALSWSAPNGQARSYVIERSYGGRTFEVVKRVRSTPGGSYRLLDHPVGDGVVVYRIRQISPGGSERVSGTLRVGLGALESPDATLLGTFPNPFNPVTTIKYEVHEAAPIHLAVWDLAGQPIATLVDQLQSPGVYEARFDANELPSGTYFVRLRSPDGVVSRKMILAK